MLVIYVNMLSTLPSKYQSCLFSVSFFLLLAIFLQTKRKIETTSKEKSIPYLCQVHKMIQTKLNKVKAIKHQTIFFFMEEQQTRPSYFEHLDQESCILLTIV